MATEARAERRDEQARPLDLSLFGSIHFDRSRKVTDELADYADDPDALFVEYLRDLALRSLALALVKNPLVLVGTAFYFLLFVPFFVVGLRNVLPMEFVVARKYADERDVALHAVDRHPLQILNDGRWCWSVVNWVCWRHWRGRVRLRPP